MNLRRTIAGVLLGVSVALTATAPAAADEEVIYVTGIGDGPTAELAVDDAIFNGIAIGRNAGFADCTPFGAPSIFRRESPIGEFFQAEQTLLCMKSIADEPFPPPID
ncbi:MAG TPA: hypothetical protein VF062_14010 [Candidatus Limnocylindrales bacterium]